MWRESSPQQYITTHHDCELHGSDCARPWLQIAVELLRQGVHDRVLCSYHLACCQLRLMRWCPMWWWNPPENSRKYPEIFKKKCNHLHISSHEHPFFQPSFPPCSSLCNMSPKAIWVLDLILGACKSASLLNQTRWYIGDIHANISIFWVKCYGSIVLRPTIISVYWD